MSTDYEAWEPEPAPRAPVRSRGPRGPALRNWRRAALNNDAYRDVQYTNVNTQVVVMSVRWEIPFERHLYSTQLVTVAAGTIAVTLGEQAPVLVEEGETIVIPAGVRHRITNRPARRGESAKLWTVYSPPVHEPDAYERSEREEE